MTTRQNPGSQAGPPGDPLVAEFLDYVRYERGLSPNTVAAYARDLGAFGAFLAPAGTRPGEAGADDVRAYFAGPGGDGAPASVARRTAAVRVFYAYLVREGVREDDPAALLRTPKRPQDLPRVLSVEEVEEILATVVPAGPLGQRDLAALELLYGCGLRVGELVGLRDGDVDVEGGLVRCVGKGDKERVVPMGGAAASAVSRYLADGRRTLLRGRRRPELILNARGGPLTRQGFDYVLRRVLARADMLGAASAHTFRHSFATHLLAAGADLRSVQEMLGHANVATTQLYTHVTVEHLREVFLETHPRARGGGRVGRSSHDAGVRLCAGRLRRRSAARRRRLRRRGVGHAAARARAHGRAAAQPLRPRTRRDRRAAARGAAPEATYGRLVERGAGKDTTTGHWEMMGVVLERPFPTYPDGFPPEVIEPFEAAIGRRVLCNRPASGTGIIEELGDEHVATGRPIVYTSADSVFQIACHEDVVPVPSCTRGARPRAPCCGGSTPSGA